MFRVIFTNRGAARGFFKPNRSIRRGTTSSSYRFFSRGV